MNPLTADDVARLLGQFRYRTATEKDLQAGIEEALKISGISHVREFRIDRGAIDFRTECGIGIECKISGSFAEVARQLLRYADSADIREILLVSSRSKHSGMPATMRGKQSRFLWVRSQI